MMKKLMVLVAVMAAGSSMGQTASDGPFGLKMGMTLEQIRRLDPSLSQSKSGLTYLIDRPPVPNSSFESYRLWISPQHGLCKIVAVGVDIDSNAFGDQIKTKFESLEQSLTTRYGKGKNYNFLKSGSIWDEPRDFMMALLKEEYTMTSFWETKLGSKLPSNLSSIMLDTRATDSTTAYLIVSYEMSNYSKCSAYFKDQNSQGL